ncbi:kinesin-like protein KIF13A isoform X10 [Nasonia vitripennis]|uniref:Kinesin-like protein KIF13A n=1 Tax=Nasonia vitripennis TaxID=7425 RepID=A0A7M7QBR7_NASVI|nr:kinesin-like protein KIF13A isoform X10 [Nasonia vitripennis]
MATDKIKVAVRVRPFNRRELELGTDCIVEMTNKQTLLRNPSTLNKVERNKGKLFAFDHCFYSLDPEAENYASQNVVFNALGRDILYNAFQGYNACIFAYGQTGSGKSYTMMGSGENLGIIPRLCDKLFDMIAKQQSSELTYKVEVSYMEIYNEKVHDLLDPKPNKQSLKVREHNVLGPYVDGLSQLAVTDFQDIDNLMAEGNKSRTVAATNMNSESSRSHAVFSVILTQTLIDPKSGVSGEKVSRISLVDLAGSERAVKTGAVGERLKEGSNINKSLTTLGLVISKLADQNSNGKNRDKFVPYRDSVLTWLLKDNLGGNSKTVMVATISPAVDNYEETLSTLRYADRAKRIVNHAVINEDPNARIIRELRQEVETLKEMLLHATGQGSAFGQQRTDITEKITESEKLMKVMSQTWEEKLVKTEQLQHERQQALEKMGISVQASGIQVQKNKYYLVNLNDDPSLNELLVYYLKETTLVGGRSSKIEQDIQLHGLGILPEHCVITIEAHELYMTPLPGSRCFVNGFQVNEKTLLEHGDRIVWGNHHFFRVNCPRSSQALNNEAQTPAQNIDYNFAREELMLNELSNDPIQRAIARLEKQHEEDKQRGAFVSEPAILVKRINMGSQVWTMEKLENKLVDMRDMYEERKDLNFNRLSTKEEISGKIQDPFYELQENHNLIGVANIFLEILFHDVRLDYHIPIISQQGEVAGRLQVEINRISGQFPHDRICESTSQSSEDSASSETDDYVGSSHIKCRVSIKQASGLPLSLSNFVFCQYIFWGYPEPVVVPPVVNTEFSSFHNITNQDDSLTFQFNHTKDFIVPITEEFIEHCSEGALSIEVWGHRSTGFSRSKPGWEVEQKQLAKARSLADRWSELTRKIELWVEIQELNEQGEYAAVEVFMKSDVLTGGIYQLRQGQQRRIQVQVKPAQNSGTLPIICQRIMSIAVGSVVGRNRLQNPLDSYQDEDLHILREKWSDALMRRRQYLDQQIQKLINKKDKSDQDIEREQSLVDQWVNLTEERNAVLVPSAGSGIPGAPADWNPPIGMEPHIPVLFLDLNADDLSAHQSGEEISISGLNSILPKEHGHKFYNLPIVKHLEKNVCAIAAWDSSIHDDVNLNKITDGKFLTRRFSTLLIANERIYLILKTTVRLSHPAPMDLILRKRLALNIYKKQSITDRIFKRIVRIDSLTQTGVTYDVVSNIPKASEELEDRESLAQIAASGEDNNVGDGETYIEKYTRGVSAVESILTLDRLRQNVAVKELLQAQGQPMMRKTASVPNFSQLMRFDSSIESLNIMRSESVMDLNSEINSFSNKSRRSSISQLRIEENVLSSQPKSLGIARPTFLNLNTSHNSLARLQQNTAVKSSPNVVNGKLNLRMTTLHEETANFANNILSPRDANGAKNRTDFCDYDDFKTNKIITPSTSSSGYGSQTVSTSNLTSDDTVSVRSISVDETPDLEYKCLLDAKKLERKDSANLNKTRIEYFPDMIEIPTKIKSNIRPKPFNLDLLTNDQYALLSKFEKPTDYCDLDINSKQQIKNLHSNSQGTKHLKKDENQSDGTTACITRQSEKIIRRKRSIHGHSSKTIISNVQSKSSEKPDIVKLEPMIQQILTSQKNCANSSEKLNEDDVSDKGSGYGSITDLAKIENLPDWVSIGESVLVRPYSYSGIIAYVGPTEFASGSWIGVELDAPTGKNDGAVNGHRYFSCPDKCGIFVKIDKLIQDRRGRAMRNHTRQETLSSFPTTSKFRKNNSKGDVSQSERSKNRGKDLSISMMQVASRSK